MGQETICIVSGIRVLDADLIQSTDTSSICLSARKQTGTAGPSAAECPLTPTRVILGPVAPLNNTHQTEEDPFMLLATIQSITQIQSLHWALVLNSVMHNNKVCY